MGPLIAFCERYKHLTGDTRFDSEVSKRLKKIFPGGMEKVSVGSFHGPPSDGVAILEQNELLTSFGLQSGNVIVALNGTRTRTFNQYGLVRDTLSRPEMHLIVWQGNAYYEFKVNPPGHKFGVDMGDYRPQ